MGLESLRIKSHRIHGPVVVVFYSRNSMYASAEHDF